jgi:hypothetical protein
VSSGLRLVLGLVDETDDLDVVRGLHELDALESTAGDKSGAVTRLGTPRDGLVLGLADGGWSSRRTPDAEI